MCTYEQALDAEGINPVIVSNPSQVSGMMPLPTFELRWLLSSTAITWTLGYQKHSRRTRGYEPELNELLDRIFSEYGLIICGWVGRLGHRAGRGNHRNTRFRFSTFWMARRYRRRQTVTKLRQAIIVPIESADKAWVDLGAKVDAIAFWPNRRSRLATRRHGPSETIHFPEPRHRIQLGGSFYR